MIEPPKMYSRRILTLVLLLGEAGLASSGFAQQSPPSPVVAALVVEENVSAHETFVGTVNPLRMATVGSAVGGRVIEMGVEEGDRVETNQPLAQLLTDTITLEIKAAEGELQLREQRLAELKNGTRPEEIAQAAARMASAEARRVYLQARYNRMQGLLTSRGAVTEEELEDARSQAIEAQQLLLEMQAAYDLAVAGPRVEVIAQAEAQVAIQQATVERLKDQRQKHTVVSRFPGYVINKLSEVGQWVNPGDPVAEVAAIDEVDVVAQVVERSVVFVRPGEKVAVEIPAFPDRIFEGTVVATIPQGDIRARTFPVKIRVKNEITADGPLIKAGMYARASLPVRGDERALLVPKDAIVLGGAAPVVIVLPNVTKPGEICVPQPVPVKLGVARDGLIQVSGTLAAGQLVVVQGNERIRPGQEVVVSQIVSEQ